MYLSDKLRAMGNPSFCHVFVGIDVGVKKVEQIMKEEVVFRNQVAQSHSL